MGKIENHNHKWLHNRNFLSSINDTYTDWMATVMFYTALHAVETLFAFDRTRDHKSHQQRNRTLKTTKRYRTVWVNYRPLHDLARIARYDTAGVNWIALDKVKGDLAQHLYLLEKSVNELMNKKIESQPIW